MSFFIKLKFYAPIPTGTHFKGANLGIFQKLTIITLKKNDKNNVLLAVTTSLREQLTS